MKQALTPITALADRPAMRETNRYDLLAPVRTLRRSLGLAPNDLAVLTALVSFMPRATWDRLARGQEALTVVFPSNKALSDRANGLDERTIRRSLVRLIDAGLIARRDSANGKRFPLRIKGAIRNAFGLDLRPLIYRQADLQAAAQAEDDAREQLRALRAEALALRATLLQRTDLDEDTALRLTAIRTLLRRQTLSTDQISAIIADLRHLLNDPEPPADTTQTAPSQPGEMTGKHGQTVRHIESEKIESKKPSRVTAHQQAQQPENLPIMAADPASMSWDDFDQVKTLYPIAPKDGRSLHQILTALAAMLRISERTMTAGLRSIGPGRTLLVLNYLIARIPSIRKPDAYFRQVLNGTGLTDGLDRGQDRFRTLPASLRV